MSEHEKIDYVEFPARDMEATRQFFEKAFNWSFNLYGEEYMDFADQGVNGGFYSSIQAARADEGSALVIFYSEDLEATGEKIEDAGGKITKPIFSFPGGRRFHFTEPSGNEFAVWSDKGLED